MLKALITGVVAATMGVTAAAQAPDTTTTRERQDMVNAATQAGARNAGNTGPAMARGSAAAAADRNTPRALPTTKEKQQAVNAATAAGSKNP